MSQNDEEKTLGHTDEVESEVALASAEANPLGNIRALVRDKTRFEPDDIQLLSEEEIDQGFQVEVRHGLEARVEKQDINGFFHPGTLDNKDLAPVLTASSETGERLRAAAEQLKYKLADVSYDHVCSGLFLAHQTKHWYLRECLHCLGKGRVDCHTCYGKKKETCWQCSGGLFVTCDAWGCNGSGRTNCSVCQGTGQVSKYVTYQTQHTVWVDGVMHTENRTDGRTEYHTCTAYGCTFGKVFCHRCTGTGRIHCPTCAGTGKITCRTCHGAGDLRCDPCSGSGKTGEAAWVDVYDTPEYLAHLPDNAIDDAQAIVQKEGPEGVVNIAHDFSYSESHIEAVNPPQMVSAIYAGHFRLSRIDVECNDQTYHLAAYGNDLKWLRLDGIVENLLKGDLDALRNALNEAADEGIPSTRIDHLIGALRSVASSELNAELVEASLGGERAHIHSVVVSPEYERGIQTAMLGALRYIYTRSAKKIWWKLAIVALIVSAVSWYLQFPPILAGLATVAAGFLIFRRRIRKVLEEALGGQSQAKRVMAMAVKGKRHILSHAIALLPASAAVLALVMLLPDRGSVGIVPSATTENTQAGSEAVHSATALYREGQYDQARDQFKQLAENGVPAAFGPYGWMILMGYGLTDGQNKPSLEENISAALPWIEKGAQWNDVWSQAAKGVMYTQGWGVEIDMSKGLALLRQAAMEGHTGAMHSLGLIYINAFNVPKNPAEARKWFGMAAEKGQPEDIYNLGLLDWHGEGVPHADHKRAVELWKQAAAKGEKRAIQAVEKNRPHNE